METPNTTPLAGTTPATPELGHCPSSRLTAVPLKQNKIHREEYRSPSSSDRQAISNSAHGRGTRFLTPTKVALVLLAFSAPTFQAHAVTFNSPIAKIENLEQKIAYSSEKRKLSNTFHSVPKQALVAKVNNQSNQDALMLCLLAAFLPTLLLLILCFHFFLARLRLKSALNKLGERTRVFEGKVKSLGFEKQILVRDFLLPNLPKKEAKFSELYGSLYHIGIWISYEKKQIAIRADRESVQPIIIPFDKITKYGLSDKSDTKTTGSAVGVSFYGIGVGTGGAKQTTTFSEVIFAIVTGSPTGGVQRYKIELHKPYKVAGLPEIGSKLNPGEAIYEAIMECAQSISDELDNIMRHY